MQPLHHGTKNFSQSTAFARRRKKKMERKAGIEPARQAYETRAAT